MADWSKIFSKLADAGEYVGAGLEDMGAYQQGAESASALKELRNIRQKRDELKAEKQFRKWYAENEAKKTGIEDKKFKFEKAKELPNSMKSLLDIFNQEAPTDLRGLLDRKKLLSGLITDTLSPYYENPEDSMSAFMGQLRGAYPNMFSPIELASPSRIEMMNRLSPVLSGANPFMGLGMGLQGIASGEGGRLGSPVGAAAQFFNWLKNRNR